MPSFEVPGFLSDSVADLIPQILGVNHKKVSTIISRDPDLAAPNELSSLEEGLEALWHDVFVYGQQVPHDRESQSACANAVGVELNTRF